MTSLALDQIAPTIDLYQVAAVQAADPLRADQVLATLPRINEAADLSALTMLMRDLSRRSIALTVPGPPGTVDALAIMRDVGIALGSLKRHGIQPLDVVPELTPLLLALGRQTDLVPRDTVQHYTVWNPEGSRRRTYTSDEQEGRLQDAVRHVFPALSASLAVTEVLVELDPRDVRFAPTAAYLTSTVRPMLEAIDAVTREVSPVFFAQVLRPYYEEIRIDGEDYLGPAAAQVPLWLVDLCVWASDRNGERYAEFLRDSLQYALPDWRAFYDRHCGRPSLVTRIVPLLRTAEACEERSPLHASASALAELLKVVKTFRGRHIAIAKKAYADDVALYDKGSGGAPVELLKEILDLTRENETVLRAQAPVPSGRKAMS